MQTLRRAGWERVAEGVTTLDEVERVVGLEEGGDGDGEAPSGEAGEPAAEAAALAYVTYSSAASPSESPVPHRAR